MKKITLALALTSLFAFNLSAEDAGKTLFVNKCATCHSLTIPTDKSQMLAPPARGVMFHMREAFSDTKTMKAHIESFVINPTEDKAICRSVRRFGLMPSQKGNITTEELKVVSQWMIDNLSMTQEEYDNR